MLLTITAAACLSSLVQIRVWIQICLWALQFSDLMDIIFALVCSKALFKLVQALKIRSNPFNS